MGAIWAVDVVDPDRRSAAEVAEAMLEAGVIVRPIGEATVALCPPLVMTDDEADRLLDSLAAAVGP